MTSSPTSGFLRLRSVSAKILTIQAISLVAMVLMSLASYVVIDTVLARMKSVFDDRVVPLVQVEAIQRSYAYTAPRSALEAAEGIISWDQARSDIRAAQAEITANWDAYLTTYLTPEEIVIVDRIKAAKPAADEMLSRLATLVQSNNAAAVDAFVAGSYYPTADMLMPELVALTQYQQVEARRLFESSTSLGRTLVMLLVGVSAAVIGISLTLVLVFGRRIRTALADAVQATRAVAEGNLDTRVDVRSTDEIGQIITAINDMTDRLRDVMNDVDSAARNVAAGSEQLAATSEELNTGATEQASSTEEASASMEQMAANIRQNAENAEETERMARQSAADARASGAAVARAVDAMQTIAERIMVVQEIARQTDLLALNAAVEAARAGEHGRGFAVVASEVRKLAERSQTAAGEISSLSASTVKAAREAGDMLSGLVPDIERTSELVSQISRSTQEQAMGASQINLAIQQLDKVTQENTAAATELSATAEELTGQAEQLQSAMGFFRLSRQGRPEARQLRLVTSQPARKSQKIGFDFDLGQAGDPLDRDFAPRGKAARGA